MPGTEADVPRDKLFAPILKLPDVIVNVGPAPIFRDKSPPESITPFELLIVTLETALVAGISNPVFLGVVSN